VTYDDSLLQRSSKPKDNSLGQLDETEENGDDIDEDAFKKNEDMMTYEDQADKLSNTDFQMNLDDMYLQTHELQH
jgi:hypothetical protein